MKQGEHKQGQVRLLVNKYMKHEKGVGRLVVRRGFASFQKRPLFFHEAHCVSIPASVSGFYLYPEPCNISLILLLTSQYILDIHGGGHG